MKRVSVIFVVLSMLVMVAGCAQPLSQSDKALLDQAIAASKSSQADAARSEAAADRAEAAAQRAEDAAMKCERAFETSVKK